MPIPNIKIVYFCGNLSAGKSNTIEKIFLKNDKIKHWKIIKIYEEIDVWKNFSENKINMLDLYYKYPKTFAFNFQFLTILTHINNLISHLNNNICSHEENNIIFLVERSLYEIKNVFENTLYEMKYLSLIDHLLFDLLTHALYDMSSFLSPDSKNVIFIYLKAPVTTLYSRLLGRGRIEEKHVTENYLQLLQEKYNKIENEWMSNPKKFVIINTENLNLDQVAHIVEENVIQFTIPNE